MDEFKKYKRLELWAEMRSYVVGEDLSGVSVTEGNTPGPGGMIARNRWNHENKWYIDAEYFRRHFEPVPVEE